jgi:ArsR family transcriptional regulator
MKESIKINEIANVLGNETRRKILFLLSQRDDYPFSLSNRLEISPRAIMQNLNILENSGLIEKYEKKSSKGPDRTYYKIKKELQLTFSLSPKCYRIKISELPQDIDTEIPIFKESFEDLMKLDKQENKDILLEKSLELLNRIDNKLMEMEDFQCGLMRLKENIFNELDNIFSNIETELPFTSLLKSLLDLGGKSDLFELLDYHKVTREELEPLIDLAKKFNLIRKRKIKEEKEYFML